MNPVRNVKYKSMSKKDLIRHLHKAEDDYLELFVSHQRIASEARANFTRFVALLWKSGGEFDLTEADLDELPLDLTKVTVHIDDLEDNAGKRFRLEVTE